MSIFDRGTQCYGIYSSNIYDNYYVISVSLTSSCLTSAYSVQDVLCITGRYKATKLHFSVDRRQAGFGKTPIPPSSPLHSLLLSLPSFLTMLLSERCRHSCLYISLHITFRSRWSREGRALLSWPRTLFGPLSRIRQLSHHKPPSCSSPLISHYS